MSWLVENTLVAAAFAGLVFAVCRLCKPRPALAHVLWLLVLLKLLCPSLLRVDLPFALPDAWREHLVAEETITLAPEHRLADYNAADLVVVEAMLGGGRIDGIASGELAAPLPETKGPIATLLSSLTVTEWLLTIWVLGSVAMLGSLLFGCLRVLRLRREGAAPSTWLRSEVEFLAQRLGIRTPRVVVSSRIGSAFVFGFGRPTLMWPTTPSGRKDLGKIRSVLAHELAHIKRRDHWTAWLEIAATIGLWWHPLMWWARARLRLAAELACDAWAMWAVPDARTAYAGALIDAVERDSQAVTTVPVLAARPGARAFEKRLKMILNEDVPRRLSAWTALPIAALSLTILSGVSFAQERTTKLRKKKSSQSSERSHARELRQKILQQVNEQLRKSLGKQYQVDGLDGIDRAVNRYVRDQMRKKSGKAGAGDDAPKRAVLRLAHPKGKGDAKDGTDGRRFRIRVGDGDDIKVIDLSKGAKVHKLHDKDVEVLIKRLHGDAERAKDVHERIIRRLHGAGDKKHGVHVIRKKKGTDSDVESLIERIHKARGKKKSTKSDKSHTQRVHEHLIEMLHGGKAHGVKVLKGDDIKAILKHVHGHGGEDHDVRVLKTDGDVKAILKRLHGVHGDKSHKDGHVIRLRKGKGGDGFHFDVDVDVDVDVKIDGKDGATKVIRRRVGDKDVEVHVRAHRLDGAKQKAGDKKKVRSLIKVLKDGKLHDLETDADVLLHDAGDFLDAKTLRGKVLDLTGKELKDVKVHVLGGTDGPDIELHDVHMQLKGLGTDLRGTLHKHLQKALDDADVNVDKKVLLELVDEKLQKHLKSRGEKKDRKDRDDYRGERRERRTTVKKKINKIV